MKHQYTFLFVDTEDEAKAFCTSHNQRQTRYMRQNHPAHYTPWSSADRTETGFVCWYWTL